MEIGFSQSELAQLLGANRPKVNATLASLERSGVLKRTMDRLFCDLDKLAAIARASSAAEHGRPRTRLPPCLRGRAAGTVELVSLVTASPLSPA